MRSTNLIRVYILSSLYLWLCLSSLVISLGYFVVGGANPIYIALKDLPIYFVMLVVVAFSSLNKLDIKVFLFFILLCMFYLVEFSVSGANTFVKFASIRQMLSIFLLILLGMICIRNYASLLLFMRYVVYVTVLIAIFGYLERLTLMWQYDFIRPYFESKSIPINPAGYPYFFIEPIYIFPFNKEISNGIVRMVATFLDPINFGHTLVLSITLLIYNADIIKQKVFRYSIIVFLLTALLLTFAKGAWLQLVLVLGLVNPKINMLGKLGLLIVIAALIALISKFHSGVMVHVTGFLSAVHTLTLFGHGLGMVGNYSAMFGDDRVTAIGDSFIGGVVGQIGLLGLVMWLFIMFKILSALDSESIGKRLLISQLLVAVLSENAFNLLSISGLGLLLGAELGVKQSHIIANKINKAGQKCNHKNMAVSIQNNE